MLWFFHGSGGESHCRTSCCNLSPIIRAHCSVFPVVYLDRNNSRSALFILLTMSCIDSITQSDIVTSWRRQPTWNIPRAPEMLSTNSFPSKYESLAASNERDQYNLLTIVNNPCIPDKTMDNFESLSRGRSSLVQGEPIQPLQGRINVILSTKLLHKFFCISLSQESCWPGRTH